MIHPIRIRVEKRLSNQELIDELGIGIAPVCPLHLEGQQWVVKDLNMPDGFCSWAWADIQRDVSILALGGTLSWIKGGNVMMVSCTDGFRPVIFRLERVDADEERRND